MAAYLKAAIFLLASLLLLTSRVSSNHEDPFFDEDGIALPPFKAPAPLSGPHWVKNKMKECPGLCLNRCSLHSRPNLCNRACNSCCRECSCVPPGTAGNKEMCGTCYAARLSHNHTKCP